MQRTRLNSIKLSVSFALLTLATATQADAQVKPFEVTGGGTADKLAVQTGEPVFHEATGTATHLGAYSGEGMYVLDAFTGQTTAEFSSAVPFVFTAANGDKLVCDYGHGPLGPGKVTLNVLGITPAGEIIVEAVFVAEFTPVLDQCTGRFAQLVDGSFVMVATAEPTILGSEEPVGYTWEGEGWLEFAEGAKIEGSSQDVIVATEDLGGGVDHHSIEGAGQSTLLGKFTRTKEMLFDWNTLTFEGTLVFTAQNGDELHADFAGGPFDLNTGLASGTYTVTGGTGRFAGATGQAQFTAFTADLVNIDVDFEGTVRLAP